MGGERFGRLSPERPAVESTFVTEGTEQVTVGAEYLSITVTRKTEGDLLVSQFAVQRWYKERDELEAVLAGILTAIIASNSHIPKLQPIMRDDSEQISMARSLARRLAPDKEHD